MRIDSHQHFWKYNTHDFGWISEDMKLIKSNFYPADLEKQLHKIGFDGSIAVQARQSLEETRWLLALSQKHDFIKGVVGWVDLRSPEVEKQLDEFSASPKFVGVRHVVHDEPDHNFMAGKEFQRGIGLLEKYKLTYDFLVFPRHLSLTTKVARQFPRQKFVLDHIAKPLIKNQVHAPWDKDIMELAANPNVYCKLSGMVTEADFKNWKPSDFTYYLETVMDCFGEDRVMIGSDWPVCTVGGDYDKIMYIVIDFIKKYSLPVQDKILGGNCKLFYLDK